MGAGFEIDYAAPFIAPFAVVFTQHFFTVFRPQFAVPEQHLDGRARQSLFDIDFPFAEPDEAFRISALLPVFALEDIMQIARFDGSSASLGKHFERHVFLIVALAVSKVRQAVMIADQVAVNINGASDAAAMRPGIFAQSRLNAELTFDQTLPRSSLVVKMMRDAEPPVRPPEAIAREL